MDTNTDFTRNDTFHFEELSSTVSSSTDAIMPSKKPSPVKRPGPPIDGAPPGKRPTPSIRLDAGFKWNLQALTNAADAVEKDGKSPVSALNELGVRVAYTVVRQGGPAHCPSFTVAVQVANMRFEGCGHSKRDARAAAAKSCLSALLARAGRVPEPRAPPHHDFTSDDLPRLHASEFQYMEGREKKDTESSPSPTSMMFGMSAPVLSHKSPINTLYETYPGISFICTYGDGTPLEAPAPLQLSHSMRFKVECYIKDQKFEGYGSSKKLAKLAAARAALGELTESRTPRAVSETCGTALPQPLADHVARMVNEKFNKLMKDDVVHSKRKVLAGIVITTDYRMIDARVIAVTTGTKCVSGEHMSVRGLALNDCHAEVAARRCLQRHLYSELYKYASSTDPTAYIENSDLEPVPGGGYQLKANRQVILYVSTAPCGDGRIFSPHEQAEIEPDKHPNRLARGQLRTKIESGEGTIPVKSCSFMQQTWDGVLQGERLLTMSCSDKVARWCVLGMQGALLARALRPVYLHAVVLGSLLHPHHLYRAICGRIEGHIDSLPPPYRLHRPLLARAASAESRTPTRAPSFSVCWSHTSPLPEIVNATTGKLESGQPSLLCKQSMFARWQYLVRRLPLLPAEPLSGLKQPDMPASLDSLLYNEAKQLCAPYQEAKACLMQAFRRAALGQWVHKPIEQDQFVCEVLDAPPQVLFA